MGGEQMRIAVVEDNKDEQDRLLSCFKKYEEKHNTHFDIITFNNGLDFTGHYNKDFDVIYLDIQMPEMDGMTAAKKIRKVDQTVPIVFVTNYIQYAIDGYQVDATDFILKPVNYFSFEEHFKRIEEKFKQQASFLLLNTLEGTQKVVLDNLYYVESEKHYLHLHLITDQEEQLDMLDTTKNMEKKLAPYNFFRCNNGYIVNLKHVSQVVGNEVIVGPYHIQISRPRKKGFMEALTNYLGGEIN